MLVTAIFDDARKFCGHIQDDGGLLKLRTDISDTKFGAQPTKLRSGAARELGL